MADKASPVRSASRSVEAGFTSIPSRSLEDRVGDLEKARDEIIKLSVERDELARRLEDAKLQSAAIPVLQREIASLAHENKVLRDRFKKILDVIAADPPVKPLEERAAGDRYSTRSYGHSHGGMG